MHYMQKHTWNAQYAKAYQICNICKNIQTYAIYAKANQICNICKNIQHLQYMQNIPNMQNKQQNTKICNKCTKHAKSYHGATGSDTTSVAEHQASLFQECPLTPGTSSSE